MAVGGDTDLPVALVAAQLTGYADIYTVVTALQSSSRSYCMWSTTMPRTASSGQWQNLIEASDTSTDAVHCSCVCIQQALACKDMHFIL